MSLDWIHESISDNHAMMTERWWRPTWRSNHIARHRPHIANVIAIELPTTNSDTMSTADYQLSTPPTDPRERELWLQHAAGFILFQDMREYARQQIDPSLDDEARAAAEKGIDDAVYGLMMVLDGVTGGMANDKNRVNLRVAVELTCNTTDKLKANIDLSDGDGMCMGYHGWRENDFGGKPPFVSRRPH
ncbi:hypothetical protein [Rhodopirellula halodulae]|uniref:hypothetical protein n=1 Tax=Rhodopirellula halodulae TaxID=2894198 RepID=UPI001E59E692|nr:hypothetical protein [Rhodopirellula sp. JC737]MCC9656733.1 hypothetical protein [Rhodopirellula sp. JC737]